MLLPGLWLTVVLEIAGGASLVAAQEAPPSLVEMANHYCVGPDGDHRLTWARIEADGFQPIAREAVEGLYLRGSLASALRGFEKSEGDHVYRVLTSSGRVFGANQGTTFYRWCWVSSSRDDRRRVDDEFQREFATRGFRVGPVRMFAWIPRPDGSLEPVSRRVYMRQGNELARTQGLRQLTTRQYEDGVFIGYASPRDEATYRGFDWRGPDPVPRSD